MKSRSPSTATSRNGRRHVARRSPSRRIDIGAIRREQIVEAAAGIIASQGIQNLSLSAIEAATGMSRGQLTYYFATKEEILLAVFDRTVRVMQERMEASDSAEHNGNGDVASLVESLLARLLMRPIAADFTQLQYSFLAQTGFRNDYRRRLASLYEQWREHMAAGFQAGRAAKAGEARLMASFVQALLHGLVMQLQADPEAFDRAAMYRLCVELLGSVIGRRPLRSRRGTNGRAKVSAGGSRHG